MKILVLGNEFIEGDSFAKDIGEKLCENFEVVNILDSFQLMGVLEEEEDFVLLDVVFGLDKVCFIDVDDLREDAILSAHDFDVGYVLKLLEKDVRIIGVPEKGNLEKIFDEVIGILRSC